MNVYSPERITECLATCGDKERTNQERGAALEALAEELFSAIPGVRFARRNNKDAFETQEIDVALWNDGAPDGLLNFDQIILIECKNWSSPVGSMELAWFDTKLRLKGRSLGILIAAKGITGKPHSLTAARSILAAALREERTIVVLTGDDLKSLVDAESLIDLIKRRILQLAVSDPFN